MADGDRSEFGTREPSARKLSKSEKKQARKQAKSRHTLLRHEGIHTSTTPTKHLIVGNGGLGNGVSRIDLNRLFSQYGQLTDIVMLPRKPYSVVCYESVQEAVVAHDRLQGWQLRPPSSPSSAVILYLSFINEVPLPKEDASHHSLPPGLILIKDFIDVETEEKLMQNTLWDQQDQPHETAQQSLKHRKVRHFGYEFNYATNNVDKDSPLPDPIPSMYVDVIDQIMSTGLVENRPDQITVNEYQPGQGIPPHVDTHSAFQDAIISLSLGSQVLMEFSNSITGRHVPVFLPRRSLLVMTGEARYLWSHGITPRKADIIPAHISVANDNSATDGITVDNDGLTLLHRGVRRSFTFRAVRGAPCHCAYPSRCDSQLNSASGNQQRSEPPPVTLPTSDLQAMHLEVTHVHRVYENIAGHFSQTRHKPWPQVVEFLQGLPMGSVLLDVGCGNGKYLDGNPQVFSIGCDRSVKLVEICSQRGFQAFSCDGLNLPVRSCSVDACICIAVIHHFSTENRRQAAVEEICRVLRPGGLGLIYVWAKEQERDQTKSHYISNSAQKDAALRKASIGTDEMKPAGSQSELSDECLNDDGAQTAVGGSRDNEGRKCHSGSSESETGSSACAGTRHPSEAADVTTPQEGNVDRPAQSSASAGCPDQDSAQPTPQSSSTNRESISLQTLEEKLDSGNSRTIQEDTGSRVLSVHTNRTQFVSQDVLVPWHLKNKAQNKDRTPLLGNAVAGAEHEPVYHRFYHVFQEGELEELCGRIDGVQIKSSHYDQGNWGVVIRKM